MLKSSFLALSLMVAASGIGVQGQAPATPETWLFIETPRIGWRDALKEATASGSTQIAKVRTALIAAGEQGYQVRFVARFSASLSMLLKHEGAGPRTYRLVAAGGQEQLLKELNDAGAQGFRLVPEGAKIFNQHQERFHEQWIAVLERSAEGARFTYTVIEGADAAAERALGEATGRGAALVATVGTEPGFSLSPKPTMFLEEPQAGGTAASASAAPTFRIVSAVKTSTLEKEVCQVAAEGFRARASGLLSVIMARPSEATPGPAEYKLIATVRVSTSSRELASAGAAGFRIALTPVSNEAVFLMERAPGASEKVEYSVATLASNTASRVLERATGEGYRVAAVLGDFAVLERPAPQIVTQHREQ